MRVIAGSLKGRRLKTPTWDGLRPTSDKLRETLFNVLAPRVAGARVLDGYAGTGALGIEALSRGAAHVTFIEQRSARAGAHRGEPGALWRGQSGYAIIRASVARGLSQALRAAPFVPFDIILLDPPYDERRRSGAAADGRTCSRRTASSCSSTRDAGRAPARAGRLRRARELRIWRQRAGLLH